MEETIIRNGNHFIRLENGWNLIDGPWFEYLSKTEGHKIVLPKWHILSDLMISYNDFPKSFDSELIEWERTRWHPGVWIDRKRLSPWVKLRYEELLHTRTRTGFRMADGKLPAFLTHPGWIEREWDCPPT